MSGIFAVTSKGNCFPEVLFGTAYQKHLGSRYAGLVISDGRGFLQQRIKSITNGESILPLFIKEKFNCIGGLGVISDRDPQPLIIGSPHGDFAIAMAGRIKNLKELKKKYMEFGHSFVEMSDGQVNQVEVLAKIIGREKNIEDGIIKIWQEIKGSANIVILRKDGLLYVARDLYGRWPLVIGRSEKQMAVSSEPFAFQNTGFEEIKSLQPGEIIKIDPYGCEEVVPGDPENLRICAFLWIYTGFPASQYEDISVAKARINCGRTLARQDIKEDFKGDIVFGVPDSGRYHGQGYTLESGLPFIEGLIKYSPEYGRSYTPADQKIRDLIARMKLVVSPEIIKNKRVVVLEDSIVRGTQLKNQTIKKLWEGGAAEIHLRVACPPLLFPCDYGRSTLTPKELIAHKFIDKNIPISSYYEGEKYEEMVEEIRRELGVNSLRYNKIQDIVEAIELPQKNLCLECWQR